MLKPLNGYILAHDVRDGISCVRVCVRVRWNVCILCIVAARFINIRFVFENVRFFMPFSVYMMDM